MAEPLGARFAHAVASKDPSRVRELLHPEIDFRAMTPNRFWEPPTPDDVLEMLGYWFEPGDVIEAVEKVETDHFADCERVGYRFRVSDGDGSFLVEQQAYLKEREGQIGWLRVMCSGWLPAPL